MQSQVVAVLAGILVAASAAGLAQTSEPVRINVKADLIEISLSRDTWWLEHGWLAPRVDVTEGMSEEQTRAFLMQWYLFELEVDGSAVTAEEIVLSVAHIPEGAPARWIIEWRYECTFSPGIHTIVGTWTIQGAPCIYGDEGDCEPVTDYSAWAGWELLQPPTLVDGLLNIQQRHTLTLCVVP
jgi:hypothetical protein